MKEINGDLNKLEDIPCSRIRRLYFKDTKFVDTELFVILYHPFIVHGISSDGTTYTSSISD